MFGYMAEITSSNWQRGNDLRHFHIVLPLHGDKLAPTQHSFAFIVHNHRRSYVHHIQQYLPSHTSITLLLHLPPPLPLPIATHTVLGRWKTLLELDQVVGGELGEQLLDGRVLLFLSLAAETRRQGSPRPLSSTADRCGGRGRR